MLQKSVLFSMLSFIYKKRKNIICLNIHRHTDHETVPGFPAPRVLVAGRDAFLRVLVSKGMSRHKRHREQA